MKQLADRKRSERNFSIHEEVYLKPNQHHLKTMTKQPISKLNLKYYVPFLILEKISVVAYQLQLPEDAKIHPVFHVSLLKRAVGTQRSTPTLPPMV